MLHLRVGCGRNFGNFKVWWLFKNFDLKTCFVVGLEIDKNGINGVVFEPRRIGLHQHLEMFDGPIDEKTVRVNVLTFK